jgi:hypothetical protein
MGLKDLLLKDPSLGYFNRGLNPWLSDGLLQGQVLLSENRYSCCSVQENADSYFKLFPVLEKKSFRLICWKGVSLRILRHGFVRRRACQGLSKSLFIKITMASLRKLTNCSPRGIDILSS